MVDELSQAPHERLVDGIALHMEAAGGVDRAAVPLGMLLAWLTNLNLLTPAFAQQHAAAIVRLKYRELKGSELLVSACGGELYWADLTSQGEAFLRDFYPTYLDQFVATFKGDPYGVEDSWDNYDQISRVLTAALMGPAKSAQKKSSKKKWWSFW